MNRTILVVLASMLLAGSAVADHSNNNENGNGHQGNHGGNTVVEHSVSVQNTNINTAVADANAEASASASAEQRQNQVQGQSQRQDNFQGNVQVTEFEDAKNPASSAPALFLAQCTSGASAQGFGGGGSLGGPDDVCLLLNYAQVSSVFGSPEDAAWALKEAKNILQVRTNSLRRFLQAIPLVGRIM